MADPTHRYLGNHAAEINGVMREPGEFVTLSAEDQKDPHFTEMLETGALIVMKGGEKTSD